MVLALVAADIGYINLDAVREMLRLREIRSAGVLSQGAMQIIPTAYEHEKMACLSPVGLKYSEKRQLVEKFLDFCRSDGKMVFAEFGYVN